MTKSYRIKGLGCASCAGKMERKIAALPGVTGARVNFLTQKLTLDAREDLFDTLWGQADAIIRTIEKDARLQQG